MDFYFIFVLIFEIRSYQIAGWSQIYYVAKDNHEVLIFLPLPPWCCNCRHIPSHLFCVVLGLQHTTIAPILCGAWEGSQGVLYAVRTLFMVFYPSTLSDVLIEEYQSEVPFSHPDSSDLGECLSTTQKGGFPEKAAAAFLNNLLFYYFLRQGLSAQARWVLNSTSCPGWP